MDPQQPQPSSIRKDINRGATITLLGNVFRLAEFGLTLLAARLFGVHAWGQYILLNAILLPAVRLACAGMDRGVAWYLARHAGAALPPALLARVRALMLALSAPSALGAVAYGLLSGDGGNGAGGGHIDPAALVLMALGVPFLVLTHLELAVALAHKKVEHEVIVKGILHPLLYLGLPCAAAPFARETWVLGAAFLAGSVVGWAASAALAAPLRARAAGAGRESDSGAGDVRAHFSALWAYAWPVGLRDLVLSAQARVDVWTLAAFLPPEAIGVYGLALTIANSVKTVRQAFDGILFAVVSGLRRGADSLAIKRAFVHAGELIIALQTPILAFLVFFAAPLLALSGPAYAAGETALLAFALTLTLTSYTGLSGMVVLGMGKSRWALANDIAALAIAAGFNLLLVPRFGLAGAAAATSLSILLSSGLWYLEVVYLIRRWPMSLTVAATFLGGLALCATAWWLWRERGDGSLASRALWFSAFAAGYAGLLLVQFREPLLARLRGRGA